MRNFILLSLHKLCNKGYKGILCIHIFGRVKVIDNKKDKDLGKNLKEIESVIEKIYRK